MRLLNSVVLKQLAEKLGKSNLSSNLKVSSSSLLRNFSSTSDEGTHPDFKPQFKGDAPPSIAQIIEQDVKSKDVFLYMKGVPEAPMCGFSSMACRILDAYGVDYGSRNVLEDPELREGIKKFTHWPTIPQIFIKGEFVGGSDILMQMHQKGELEEAFGTPEE